MPAGAPSARGEGGGSARRVLRLDIAYDGSGFAGYARQPGKRTVQGDVEDALKTVLRAPFKTTVAGRTDAGVHAVKQVVSVATASSEPVGRIRRSLETLLSGEVVILSVAEAGPGFDARRDAISRTYRYRLLLGARPDPTRRNLVWWAGEDVDAELLREASGRFIGEHDFRAFCRKPAPGASTVRRILEAGWRRPRGDAVRGEIWLEIRGNAFCHQMVRRMTGWCVAVARGRAPLADPGELEVLGCSPAPPQGLCLVGVEYPRGVR